jgi:putative ABC transport system substrate-binding protein
MKRLKCGLIFLAAFWALEATLALAYTVSVNQFLGHPSLDEAVRGFKEQLAEIGLEVTYLDHNAQGSQPVGLEIISRIKEEAPDLILAVSAPSAQSTVGQIKDIPILFTAVADPVASGLVQSIEKPGANVTGTSNLYPVDLLLALISDIQPGAKNIGVIYNSEEANSVVQVNLAKKLCSKYNFTLIEAVVQDSAGLFQAVQSLVGRVDAIYLPTDNTVISGVETIINVALDQHIPIYPSETNSVHKGGVASLAIDYYQLGRQTGRMAAKILKDETAPAELPVEYPKQLNLVVNTAFATDIFLSVPAAIVERAKVVIK